LFSFSGEGVGEAGLGLGTKLTNAPLVLSGSQSIVRAAALLFDARSLALRGVDGQAR
jgi:hypothetical protein